MLMRVGVVALVAALAFAGGVFLGREHPSDSGTARWFREQPDVNQAFEDLGRQIDELNKWFATPTP